MHYDTAVKKRVFGYQNTRVWKSVSKDNTQLEQIFITYYRLLVSRETCSRVASFTSASKHRRKITNLKSHK